MRLGPHEVAKRLLEMRKATKILSVRVPVAGSREQPLPYRHPFIGLPMPHR